MNASYIEVTGDNFQNDYHTGYDYSTSFCLEILLRLYDMFVKEKVKK